MNELKSYKLFHRASALTSPEFLSVVEFGNGDEVYLKSEADKVIAELEESHKMEVEQLLMEIVELKTKNKRLEELKDKYSSCAEKAIDSIAKCELKIRSLSRALFKACANWAYATENLASNFLDVYEAKKWAAVYARCIKKAGEYK